MTGWNDRTAGISRQQLRETIQAAHDALSEAAHGKGLNPGGERALDLCREALAKLGNDKRQARSL